MVALGLMAKHKSSPVEVSVDLTEELEEASAESTFQISNQARRPAEFKHIIKRRKRNQLGFP